MSFCSFRYGKYKPLTQPAKCVKCLKRTVKAAYQIVCVACVEETGVCAKCGQRAETVNDAAPTAAEQARLDAEFQRDLKALPERKRRTFLRQLKQEEEKATAKVKTREEGAVDQDEEEEEEVPQEEEAEPRKSLLQVRQEAREKLKVWREKYAKDEDFDFGDDDEEDSDDE